MKKLLLGLIISLGLATAVNAQMVNESDFTMRGIDFNGPPGFWVRTDTTGNLGSYIGEDDKGRFRIDLYDDGGRFVINQRCGRKYNNRRNPRRMFTMVVTLNSKGNTFIRNCQGGYQTLSRGEGAKGLLQFLGNSNPPQPGSQIDSYLIQIHVYAENR